MQNETVIFNLEKCETIYRPTAVALSVLLW